MKVFGYIRVSSKGQLEGDGPERQAAAITAFQPNAVLVTEAISGTAEGLDRPVLAELLAQKNCTIVVEKMDRLARDLVVSELILRECRKGNIKVYAADQGLIDLAGSDTHDNPSRTLIRQILGAVAQFEKAALVAKLAAAKRRIAARTGKPCGGGAAYGLWEGEANIKRLANDFVKAGHSLTTVARLLNDAGFQTRFKKPWSKMTVYAITRI